MAAIVSQLAAANRKRKANKTKEIPIEKSVYKLPPFDPCFKAELHNNYVRNQLAHRSKLADQNEQSGAQEDDAKSETINSDFREVEEQKEEAAATEHKKEPGKGDHTCFKLLIAFLCLLAIGPLIFIIIYLMGMFVLINQD